MPLPPLTTRKNGAAPQRRHFWRLPLPLLFKLLLQLPPMLLLMVMLLLLLLLHRPSHELQLQHPVAAKALHVFRAEAVAGLRGDGE